MLLHLSVSHSVHRGGGSVPACATGHMTRGSLSGGVSVQRGVSIQEGLYPDGSLSRGCPFLGGLCQGESPYGNKWVVCILLECILVV